MLFEVNLGALLLGVLYGISDSSSGSFLFLALSSVLSLAVWMV
jgi:hypothetical protein